jgi:hypothetical protein
VDGIASISPNAIEHQEIFVATESCGERSFHLSRIFDIVFDDDDELKQIHLAQGQQHRPLSFAKSRLMHRNNSVQSAHSNLCYQYASHGRNHSLQRLTQRCGDCDAAEQAMLSGIAGQDRLINCVMTMGDAFDRAADAPTVLDVKAVKFRNGSLIDEVVGIELASKNYLGVRWNLEIHGLALGQLQRFP